MKKKLFAAIILGAVLYAANTLLEESRYSPLPIEEVRIEEVRIEEEKPIEHVEEVKGYAEPADATQDVTILKDTRENAFADTDYFYEYLSDEEKIVYMEILTSLQNRQSDVELSTTDPDLVNGVFQSVLNDHPEIFYVEMYHYVKYTRNDAIVRILFSGDFSMTEEEQAYNQSRIDAYVEECLRGIDVNASEYDKVKYVYDYIIRNTDYNLDSENNQNICSVFVNQVSVCQGYAKAFQYLLKKLGMEVIFVKGRIRGGEAHAWNMVRVDGEYYYVDVTWGDAIYQQDEAYEVSVELPIEDYDYLCVTTEMMNVTHQVDSIAPLPECTSLLANYYVREGVYFTSYDREQLVAKIDEAKNLGKAYITLKCADSIVFETMVDALIEKQEIFEYVDGSKGIVAYAENEKQLSIRFWLTAE